MLLFLQKKKREEVFSFFLSNKKRRNVTIQPITVIKMPLARNSLFKRALVRYNTRMATILLVIIYLAFISLGLPDSLVGSAWPVMHSDLNVPVSFAGIITMIIASGTIVSSTARR